jgi:hypothetical protein
MTRTKDTSAAIRGEKATVVAETVRRMFARRREIPTVEVEGRISELGIEVAPRTVHRVKRALGFRSRKRAGGWVWVRGDAADR